MAFSARALRVQAPLIVIAAIAPLFCLLEDMAIKHVFATLHYVAIGLVIGSLGGVNHISLGMVIRKTEELANKSRVVSKVGKVQSLKNMKTLKREVTSQCIQNTVLALLFAFWPFLQVRASWNISIGYPLVQSCLLVPIATKVFWPKRKQRKIGPAPEPRIALTGEVVSNDDNSNVSAVRPPALVSTKEKQTINPEPDSANTAGDGTGTPHQKSYTATTTVNIIALPHDDDDDNDDGETPTARHAETKSAEPTTCGRRGAITIDSIPAVSNIVNMILAPMVIVPFLDYLTLGKIPRSNTAKPGTVDGATAKMGSVESISQPLTNGWTVVFISVRRFVYVHP